MKINFIWVREPNSNQKKAVENNIINWTEIIEKACHQDVVKCTLSIEGPLETLLSGNVECSCGKKILSFNGNEFGDKLEPRWY